MTASSFVYTIAMAKAHVAVLRGGPSHTYDLSIRTGNEYLTHLDTLGVVAHDIFIDKQGVWYRRGLPVPTHIALEGIDTVLNTLSGEYAEDGQLRQCINQFDIPMPGSSVFASHVAFDKVRTRYNIPKISGIHMPQSKVFYAIDFKDHVEQAIDELFHSFGPPYVLKPLRGSASVSTVLAYTIPDALEALSLAFIAWDAVIIEEYIRGTEITAGVLRGMRDTELYALPAVEIRLATQHAVHDYDTKFNHSAEYICPTTLSYDTKQAIEAAAKEIHNHLELGSYSRSDFKVHPSGRVYFLETNTEPEITAASPFGVSLDAVGISMPQLLEHFIEYES